MIPCYFILYFRTVLIIVIRHKQAIKAFSIQYQQKSHNPTEILKRIACARSQTATKISQVDAVCGLGVGVSALYWQVGHVFAPRHGSCYADNPCWPPFSPPFPIQPSNSVDTFSSHLGSPPYPNCPIVFGMSLRICVYAVGPLFLPKILIRSVNRARLESG